MKPKIPATRVKSDDCAINIGQVVEDGEVVNPGVPHYIHQDEWVDILPVMTVKEVVNLSRLQVSGSDPGVLAITLQNCVASYPGVLSHGTGPT